MSKYAGKIVTNLAPVSGNSVAFDGTGDWLSIADNAQFNLGTSSYTMEFWVYPTSFSALVAPFSYQWNSGGGTRLILFAQLTTGNYLVYYYDAGNSFTTASPVTLNAWNHIALVRNGNVFTLYINGVSTNTATNAITYADSPYPVYIGSSYDGSTGVIPYVGYISNVRVVIGTAVYTSNFTPSTVPLTAITNTRLLTCQSQTIVDNSPNNFAITVNGNAAVSSFSPFPAYNQYNPYTPALGASTPGVWTLDEAMQAAATRQWNMYDPSFQNTTLLLHGNPPNNAPTWITDASMNNFAVTLVGGARSTNFSPFSLTTYPTSGSGYFNRNGSYLTLPSDTALSFGTGDFTVEGWFYIPSVPGGITLYSIGQYNTDGLLFRYDYFQLGSTTLDPSTFTPLGVWFHCAVTRSGTSLKVFINGSTVATATNSTNHSSVNGVYIATSTHAPSTEQLLGYISNFRIVKGTALYTSNFTPPTAPLTAVTNTQLLTLQTSQSANNNAFLDSSSNNFLITRNGNTTQGSFSPFSQTGWSNYFDGSGDYISAPANAAFNFGTGDFTIEFWYYPNSISGARTLIEVNYGTAPNFIMQPSSGVMNFYTNGVSAFVASNVTDTIGSWYHYAAVRNGSTITLYRNGISVGTTTYSGNVGNSSAVCFVGGSLGGGGYYIDGYLSNVRVVKGTAVYTANFTPSSIPLTAITNTSLLTCQSNRFVDNSTNGFVISVAGNTSIQAFSPFYPTAAYTPQTIGGSGYFDGTGDCLTSSFGTAIGTGDFTMEAWVYPTTAFVNTYSDVFIVSGGYGLLVNNGQLRFYGITNSTVGGSVVVNAWNHVAAARSGSTIRLFLNGVQTASSTSTDNITGTNLFIGSWTDVSSEFWTGYISGGRILVGTALYTTGFTPPTSPPTAISNTRILLNFTNAGIVDSTAKNVLETVGNAQISTAVSKFGGSSMYFDGTGDYLSTIATPNLALGSGDFTIEAWVYANSLGSFNGVVAQWPVNGGSTSNSFVLESVGSNMEFYWSSGSTLYGPATLGTISTGTWTHYAICRSGNTLYPFKNGVLGSTVSITQTLNSPTSAVTVGGLVAGSGFWNGYIDDLRITRGIARYIGNFTPQTSQWQDQ